jgi:ribonuclease-3
MSDSDDNSYTSYKSDSDLSHIIGHDGDVSNDNEELVFDPYNPENTEITLNEIQSILIRYGIKTPLNNFNLYRRAFIHRSYTKRPAYENENNNIRIVERPTNCIPLSSKSNERLEFLGDGVLELVTKYYLYRRFPKADEGFMTEKKIAIVKNEHIGKLAYEMRLHKWLIMSKHAESKNTRTNLKKLGCLFEAFIGAIFLDFNKINVKDEHGWFTNVFSTGPGFQMAQTFIESIFEQHIDWVKLIKTNDNYKNLLQVKIQKEFKTTPDYVEIDKDSENGYKMGVYLRLGVPLHTALEIMEPESFSDTYNYNFKKIQDKYTTDGSVFILLGTGQHNVKRKAEQLACETILEKMEM